MCPRRNQLLIQWLNLFMYSMALEFGFPKSYRIIYMSLMYVDYPVFPLSENGVREPHID